MSKFFSGMELFLILTMFLCMVSTTNGEDKANDTENEYIKRLENDLKSQERLIADMKKRGTPDVAEMFAADAKLTRQQLADARKLVADGKEFGQAEYQE